jgi:hypothetical protein
VWEYVASLMRAHSTLRSVVDRMHRYGRRTIGVVFGAPTRDEVLTSSRGYSFGRTLAWTAKSQETAAIAPNPLEAYVDSHLEGPGLWKWRHYFDIYHRHLGRFVGKEVHLVEVGVYSGGSLGMWRAYFGPNCHVYGVDIEPACRAYADEGIEILIGDQGNPQFWGEFVDLVPTIDIVIDDGSHRPADQIITLEALLSRIRPGGVYICEDVHTPLNEFHDYVNHLSRNLHDFGTGDTTFRRHPTTFQRGVHSIHLYPFVIVIERRDRSLDLLEAPKHGTQWQPF